MTTERAGSAPALPDSLQPLGLHQLREVQIRILRRFVAFCRTHDLTYYLYGGTLLGAVVHQGYIPWDDDIDLIMPRRDYERFRALSTTAGDDGDFVIVDERSGADHPYPFIKLGEPGTVLIDHTAGGRRFPINIDVFPLDPWARPGARRVAQQLIRDLIRRYIELAVSDLPGGWRRPFGRAAKVAAMVVPAHRAARVLGRVAQWGRANASEQSGLLAWGPGKFMPTAAFGLPSQIRFEGVDYDAPADPETILTLGYSAHFRVIPPRDQQVSPHDFDAFA